MYVKTRIVSIVLICLLVASCAGPSSRDIQDVRILPQRVSAFLDMGSEENILLASGQQDKLAAEYLSRHFSPWEMKTPMNSPEKLFWGHAVFAEKDVYGENKRKRSKDWLENLVRLADVENFPSRGFKGITVRNTDMRVLPTIEPVFHEFSRAGEGFPFDYNQNTALAANTPVFITHASKNSAWLLAESSFAYGWVPAADVARVDEFFADQFQTGTYAVPLKDNLPVRDRDGIYRFDARIGTLLPVCSHNGDSIEVFLAVSDRKQRSVPVTTRLSFEDFAIFPAPLTPKLAAEIGGRLLGQSYGWGGLYGNRDCSATTRDILASFGIWLPRNSSKQAEHGQVIDLKGLPADQKNEIILEQGVPFLTLLNMPGHVMLYIGEYKGRAAALHSTWGLKTWDLLHGEGRRIIGSTVITTLQPGRELMNLSRPEGLLINRISSMSILGLAEAPTLK